MKRRVIRATVQVFKSPTLPLTIFVLFFAFVSMQSPIAAQKTPGTVVISTAQIGSTPVNIESIVTSIVDLLKTYAFQGGIAGIVVGAFLFFGLAYLLVLLYREWKGVDSLNTAQGIIRLFLLLFFALGVIAMLLFSINGVTNWKSISASRLTDKHWAVQLETDDSIEDALKNKKRFQDYFKDIVVMEKRDPESKKTNFYLFNLYSDELDADNGTETAHREYEKLGYGPDVRNSASTKDLSRLCKQFEASEDGTFYRCKNE